MNYREPGTGIGGRYTLRERRPLQDVAEGAELWAAVDETVGDAVLLFLVEGAEAAETLDAGRRAALVTVPGLVPVLDVDAEDELTWVVYPAGAERTLADLTEGGTALRAETARAIVGEAATALDAARRRGVRHQVLRADRLLVAADGTVSVLGAGVDAAAAGLAAGSAHSAQRQDATDLVRLLFLGLTGESPAADSASGLVPLPSWRSARTVPEDLDRLCDDVLNSGPAGGDDATPVGLPNTDALIDRLGPWQSVRVTLQSWDPDDEGPATEAMDPVAGQDGTAPERDQGSSETATGDSTAAGPAAAGAGAAGAGAAGAGAATAFSHIMGRETGQNEETSEGAARLVEDLELRERRRPAQFPGAMEFEHPAPPPPSSEVDSAATPPSGTAPAETTPSGTPPAQTTTGETTSGETTPAAEAPAATASSAASPGPDGEPDDGTTDSEVPWFARPELQDDAPPAGEETVPPHPAAHGSRPGDSRPGPIIVPGRERPLSGDPGDGGDAGRDTGERTDGASDRASAAGTAAAGGAAAGIAAGTSGSPAGASDGGARTGGSSSSAASGSGRSDAPRNRRTGEGEQDSEAGQELLGMLGVAMGTDDERYETAQSDVTTRKSSSTWILLAAVLLVLLATVFAITTISSVGRGGQSAPPAEQEIEVPAGPATTSPAPAPEPEPTTATPTLPPPTIVEARAIAAQGENPDHEEDVHEAIDQDGDTRWRTHRYASEDFGNLKDGSGLWLQFEEKSSVSAVEVDSYFEGGHFEIRSGDPAAPASAQVIGEGTFAANGTTTVELEEPIEAEGLIFWITELPQDPSDGRWRAEVPEIRVR